MPSNLTDTHSGLRPALAATLVVLLLLLAACGSGDDADETAVGDDPADVTDDGEDDDGEDADEPGDVDAEDEEEGEEEGEGEEEREAEAREQAVCEGDPTDTTLLPDDFPPIDGLTLVEAEETGPSNVASGYFDGGLQDAYDAFLAGFETAGYVVTFDEIERDDAEVTYETPEGDSDGIVRLNVACGGESPVAVRITNRPA